MKQITVTEALNVLVRECGWRVWVILEEVAPHLLVCEECGKRDFQHTKNCSMNGIISETKE